MTSPECIFDTTSTQELFQLVPTMEKEDVAQGVEASLLQLLYQQETSEQSYLHGMLSQPG